MEHKFKKECGRTYCNWLHPPSYHTTASSLLRLAANSLRLHNMWIIAMFYQGIKQVWRKLSASCTSLWQNACINSDLVNTIKTSGPIKHFYEVKRQLYRFCPAAPKIYAVPFAAACMGTKGEGNLQSQETSVAALKMTLVIRTLINHVLIPSQICVITRTCSSVCSNVLACQQKKMSWSSLTQLRVSALYIFHVMTLEEFARWHRGSLFTLYLCC